MTDPIGDKAARKTNVGISYFSVRVRDSFAMSVNHADAINPATNNNETLVIMKEFRRRSRR